MHMHLNWYLDIFTDCLFQLRGGMNAFILKLQLHKQCYEINDYFKWVLKGYFTQKLKFRPLLTSWCSVEHKIKKKLVYQLFSKEIFLTVI